MDTSNSDVKIFSEAIQSEKIISDGKNVSVVCMWKSCSS